MATQNKFAGKLCVPTKVMKIFGIPNLLLLLAMFLLLSTGTEGISAGVFGNQFRHNSHSTTSPAEADGTNLNVTAVVGATISRRVLRGSRVAMTHGRSVAEAVFVGRPGVDFVGILRHGRASQIAMALCHPSRLIRAALVGWATAECCSRWGFFRRRSGRTRPRTKKPGKQYRRYSSTRTTYTKNVRGLIEEPPDAEQFQDRYAGSTRSGKPRARSGTSTFHNLVPESREKGSLLTETQKETVLDRFEVPHAKPARRKNQFKLPRLTRKEKFATASIAGHLLSPFLLTSTGGGIAGWAGALWAAAEVIPRINRKFKLDVLKDNELERLLDWFRDSDVPKAILLGSFVGATRL